MHAEVTIHTMFHSGSMSYQFFCPGEAYAFPDILANCDSVCASSTSGPVVTTRTQSFGSDGSDRSGSWCTAAGERGL